MTNIVILDDDPTSAEDLCETVERLLPENYLHRTITVTSFDELTSILSAKERVDLLITDIVMPDGQPTGIDIVRRLFPPSSGTQVIYVSGYLDQALEVYPTNHLYFLLKPLDEEKLAEALALALSAVKRKKPSMLRIKVGHREQLIRASTIVYMSSNLRKVTIHCRERSFETYARLDDLIEQLPDGFVRCHRSFVVNLAYVASLEDDTIELHDGTELPVSRRRAKEVQRALLARISGRSASQ